MEYYFTLVKTDIADDNSIYMNTSDVRGFCNDDPNSMQKVDIKLEQDLPSLDFIYLSVQECRHEINVKNNAEQTEKYAHTIFEELTRKGWNYVADGVMLGGDREIIFGNVE